MDQHSPTLSMHCRLRYAEISASAQLDEFVLIAEASDVGQRSTSVTGATAGAAVFARWVADAEREQVVRDFAIARHGDQKYGVQPYAVHLMAVRKVLFDFGYGPDLGAAAWAHDLLEDTATTRDELENVAGVTVAGLVWAVTGTGANRRERWASAAPKIRHNVTGADILKLADRIANVEASAASDLGKHQMYRKEHTRFCLDLRGFGDPAMWKRLDAAIKGG